MRNKTTIIVLLLIFSAICLSNLVFTYIAFDYESGLTEAEMKDLPGNESYRQAKNNAFSLGLDLQGGIFITMEVVTEEILLKKAGSSVDGAFTTALASADSIKATSDESLPNLFYQELRKSYLAANANDPNADSLVAKNLLLQNYFTSDENNIEFGTLDDDILEILNDDVSAAVQNTFTIIRTRVDQFGVTSPNIQQEENSGRILLELPGVQDTARVRKLISNTAKLEFRTTHKFREIANVMQEIDQKVRDIKGMTAATEAVNDAGADGDSTGNDSLNGANPVANADSAEKDSNAADPLDNLLAGDEDGAADDPNIFEQLAGDGAGDSEDSADYAASLADTAGMTDEQKLDRYREERPFLGLFDVLTAQNPDGPVVGYSRATRADTAAINEWLNHPEVKEIIPYNVKFLWEAKPTTKNQNQEDVLALIAIKTTDPDKAPLEGDVIVEAYQDFEPNSVKPAVFMNMNSEGTSKWADLTRNNENRSIAIVMDDLVYSYPNVNDPITTGRSIIQGSFTIEEAKDLANLLKAGALPVRAKVLGQNQIGPSLGADNLNKGLFSFLVAFLITIGFMFFYYSSSGLIANVALIVNLFYILGVSAAFNIVFTLPGLAAVVLTMGMAVDANVLIFERIREEQLAGKSFKAAIAAGFKNAFSSVMDANITTFLTGLILFAFGLGPIRGFAVSLMIGIVTSLISALFITRLILEYYANKGNDSVKFGSKLTLSAFSKVDMGMTRRKKVMYVVSGILVAGSIASIAINSFQLGVDFNGGRQYRILTQEEVNPSDIRKELTDAFEGETPVLRTIAADTTGYALMITTDYKFDDPDATDDIEASILGAIENVAPGSKPMRRELNFVGPTVADDIRTSAYWSVGFSLLIIFMYILIRFRGVRYSLGAIAALFHDVAIVLGIFSLFGALDILPFSLEVDQAFIAAVLTIIGYSINDTVVVFDRIRENFGNMKSADASTVYDTSINQTISRTLITSLTTMLTILILMLFGGDVLRPFMFALLVGIVVGTYSSIFVASPISHDLIKVLGRGKDAAPAKKGKKA